MPSTRTTQLPAQPEAMSFQNDRTALVINDMQHAFCSPGGYAHRIGFDVSDAPRVIANIQRLCTAARRHGITVIHMQHGFSPDQHEAPPTSPVWHKSNALKYMRTHPQMQGQILTEGSWDHELVEGLQPQAHDILLRKCSDNGFAGTPLDSLLRKRDIQTLLVCGISSNVGVESTLRSAYHRNYFGVMVSDACMAVGPAFMQAATEFNVATFFGWVTTVDQLLTALDASPADPDPAG